MPLVHKLVGRKYVSIVTLLHTRILCYPLESYLNHPSGYHMVRRIVKVTRRRRGSNFHLLDLRDAAHIHDHMVVKLLAVLVKVENIMRTIVEDINVFISHNYVSFISNLLVKVRCLHTSRG